MFYFNDRGALDDLCLEDSWNVGCIGGADGQRMGQSTRGGGDVAQGLADGGQFRPQMARRGDVIEADDGQIIGHNHTAFVASLHRAQGHFIVLEKDARDGGVTTQKRINGIVPALHQKIAFNDRRLYPQPSQRFKKTSAAVAHLVKPGWPRHHGDFAVPLVVKIRGRECPPALVVQMYGPILKAR